MELTPEVGELEAGSSESRKGGRGGDPVGWVGRTGEQKVGGVLG